MFRFDWKSSGRECHGENLFLSFDEDQTEDIKFLRRKKTYKLSIFSISFFFFYFSLFKSLFSQNTTNRRGGRGGGRGGGRESKSIKMTKMRFSLSIVSQLSETNY